MVTVWEAGVPCKYEISGYGNVPKHNHTMDDLDAIKRNQRIKDIVAASVQDGFRPAEITDVVKASHRPEAAAELTAAGGTYFERQDVINAGLKWKKLHPDHRFLGPRFQILDQWQACAE